MARESSLDSSLTTILFEVTMKLASLCDSKFFLLAQGSSDRIFAGSRNGRGLKVRRTDVSNENIVHLTRLLSF